MKVEIVVLGLVFYLGGLLALAGAGAVGNATQAENGCAVFGGGALLLGVGFLLSMLRKR